MSRISTLLLSISLALPFAGTAQTLSVSSGATLRITPGTTLAVKGDAVNGGLFRNFGTFDITGDFTSNSPNYVGSPGTTTWVFAGTAAQAVLGTGTFVPYNLVVDNPAGLTLNVLSIISGSVNFTNGVVTVGSAAPAISFSPGATHTGASDASHVAGPVRWPGIGAFTFPVGDGVRYQPVSVNLTDNGTSVTVRYYSANGGTATYGAAGSEATPLLFYNDEEYWDITPATTATGTVTIFFDDYKNPGINNLADLRVARYSGGAWQNEGGTATGTVANGSVTSNSLSTFSPFTLGSVSFASPLPIHLAAFTGAVDGPANRLAWATGLEDAGAIYDVERSTDGQAFAPIGWVAGTGSNGSYAFHDRAPAPTAYYRLRMSAPGTAATYSATILLRRAAGGAPVVIYPIPATDVVTIATPTAALAGTPAQVIDAAGRVVAAFTLAASQTLDVRAWPAGTYTLRLADGTTAKIAKQ